MAKPTKDSTADKPAEQTQAPPESGAIPDSSQLPATVPKAPAGRKVYEILAPTGIDASKLKRLSLPPIVKPSQVGVGVAISGTIRKVGPSPVASYKSELLYMEHANGTMFCFPATAVVEKALKSKFGSLDKAVGATIVINGLGSSLTSDGKRNLNLFEVFVVEG